MMSLHSVVKTTAPRQRGVTLIELMVGLLLGIVVVLVTAQVLSFSEGQKRVTTGGGDAQVNGALGLYTMQREIQMAGYGLLSELSLLGCAIQANHATAGAFNWTLAPVMITAGASGAPDSVTVMYSDRNYTVPGIISVNHPTTADRFTVRSALGFSVNDIVFAVPASPSATNWCGAYQVTGIANTNQLVHDTSSNWNNGGQVAPTGGYLAGDRLLKVAGILNGTSNYVLSRMGASTDSMTDVLARLPQVDPAKVGLADYGRSGQYIARQVARWSKQYAELKTEEIPAMEKLAAWLPQNIPAEDPTTIVTVLPR